MIAYPLTRSNRLRLARAFAQVQRVDISIDCIVEDQMGVAFVDSVENPQIFMIEQGGFFCYFAGDMDAGRDFLSKVPGGRLLMAGSEGWGKVLQAVFGERLRQIARYSYSSESLSLDHLKQLASENPHTPNVKRIDATLAGTEDPYIKIGAYESADDFEERGIGFCMLKDDKIIGRAYASLVCSNAIEVGIVVDPNHQRQGIATAMACQLLQWCLEHHVAPHWDAANQPSCSLAEKLGYSNKAEYVAYYLKGE